MCGANGEHIFLFLQVNFIFKILFWTIILKNTWKNIFFDKNSSQGKLNVL
jgi:hypothetical protein